MAEPSPLADERSRASEGRSAAPCRAARRRAAAFALLGAALVAPVAALDPGKSLTQYRLRVWQTSDGLPNNHVHAIAQARDGRLWLGTEEGAARFDGLRFEPIDRRRVPVLPANTVSAIVEDRLGTIWIATGGGVARFADGEWSRAPAAIEGALRGYVTSFALAPDDRLWLGASESGLAALDGARVEAVRTPTGPLDEGTRRVVVDSRGVVLALTRGGDLLEVDTTGAASRVPLSGSSAGTLQALAVGGDGTVWAGGSRALLRRPAGSERWESVATEPPPRAIRQLFVDRSGTLWIGTNGAGLARLRDGALERLSADDGLPSDIVDWIFEDDAGRIWLGTNGGGLVALSDEPFTAFGEREGVIGAPVWTIVEERGGPLWLGTHRGLTAIGPGGVIGSFGLEQGLENPVVLTLAEAGGGGLWIGTAGGLFRLERSTIRRRRLGRGLDGADVRALHEDRRGRLWLGTFGAGLALVDEETVTRFGAADGLPSDFVTGIREDSAGDLWIATSAGLVRARGGRFERYVHGDPLADALGCVQIAPDGAVWTGGAAGLARWRDGRAGRLALPGGPIDENVHSIVEDAAGFFWLGSNLGVVRVSRSELEAFDEGRGDSVRRVRFGVEEGLPSGEMSGALQNASVRSRDGALWFATYRGAARVDPAAIDPGPPPVVRVDELVVDGRPLPAERAEAPPGRREVTIRYSIVELGHPERVRFRYRLGGFDTDWREARDGREAHYTSLPPGRYRFAAQAAWIGGDWPAAETVASFTLRPRFHETGAFRVALLAGVAGAITLGLRLRTRALRRRARALEATIRARTEELLEAGAREAELRAVKAQLQPHFLMNSLNSVAALQERDPRSARSLLLQLADFLHIVFERMELDNVSLAEEIELVRSYLELEQVRLGDRLRFEIAIESGALDVPVPPFLLQPLVENAVRHGVSPSAEPGWIRLEGSVADGRLTLVVADSGPGFELAEGLERGHGLGLTARRLRAAYGEAGRLDAERAEGGFRVRIVLPATAGEEGG